MEQYEFDMIAKILWKLSEQAAWACCGECATKPQEERAGCNLKQTMKKWGASDAQIEYWVKEAEHKGSVS